MSLSSSTPPQRLIKAVGHVALYVTDLDSAVAHATSILGLREVTRTADASFLTCDVRHHSLEYRQADVVALDHVGLQAYDRDAMTAVEQRLRTDDIPFVTVTEAGIAEAIRFEGPAGHVFEVYAEIERSEPEWYPTNGVRPQRFGHVTLKADDVAPTEAFLERILGFRVSDRVDEGLGTWLRCSEAHHSLAVLRGGNGIHHYSFDVEHVGELARFADRLSVTGQRLVYGPGRHGVGKNIFTYHRDANGVLVEHVADLERIDDEESHVPGLWPNDPDMENLWGPLPNDPEFNDWCIPLVSLSDARRA